MRTGVFAEWIVPVDGPPVERGWILAEDGVVIDVGAGRAPAECGLYRSGMVVTPGFVSAHVHLPLGALRGVADDASFLPWISRGVLPATSRIDAEAPHLWLDGARLSASELLRSGVTCVGENHFRLDGMRALAEKGMRGVFFAEVFGSLAPDEEVAWRETERRIDDLPSDFGGLPWGLSPHTPWTCPRFTFGKTVERARRDARRLSFHLEESAEERDFLLRRTGPLHAANAARGTLERFDLGMTPTELVDRAGALGPTSLVAHVVVAESDDLDRLARTGTHVVHCPTSNLKLGEGIADVPEMRRRGINVALGTDSFASSARGDFFEEMRVALWMARGHRRDASVLTAVDVLAMATTNGAEALGLGARIGGLSAGKAADWVVHDVLGPGRRGVSGPAEAVVFLGAPEHVRDVVIAGDVRHRNGA